MENNKELFEMMNNFIGDSVQKAIDNAHEKDWIYEERHSIQHWNEQFENLFDKMPNSDNLHKAFNMLMFDCAKYVSRIATEAYKAGLKDSAIYNNVYDTCSHSDIDKIDGHVQYEYLPFDFEYTALEDVLDVADKLLPAEDEDF